MCGVWMREEIGERSNKYEGLGGCRVDLLSDWYACWTNFEYCRRMTAGT